VTANDVLSVICKGKGSPYSITEHRVPELSPVPILLLGEWRHSGCEEFA